MKAKDYTVVIDDFTVLSGQGTAEDAALDATIMLISTGSIDTEQALKCMEALDEGLEEWIDLLYEWDLVVREIRRVKGAIRVSIQPKNGREADD